jgi:transcriptional regulator with XRE-family HTH domain
MILFDVPTTLSAQEFRERRQRLGSQRNVSLKLGLSRHTLSRWENSADGYMDWHPELVRLALEALEARHATFKPELDVSSDEVFALGEAVAAGADV